jgi:hypothetical protein
MGAFKGKSSRLAATIILSMVAGAALVWAIPAVAGLAYSGDNQVGSTVSKWVARNSNDDQCEDSSQFVDMDDTFVTFHTTGFHKRVLVLFEASWEQETDDGPADTSANVQLLIDGDPVDVDGIDEVELVNPPVAGGDNTHGFNWVSGELHPGSHTAELRFRRTSGGPWQEICVDERSIVVLTP